MTMKTTFPTRTCGQAITLEIRRVAAAGMLALGVAGCVLVLAGPGSAAGRGTSAPMPPITAGSRYLALGDSVTFGYQEPQVIPAPDYSNAASFVA